MKRWVDWRGRITDLGVSGIVQELNTGTLVLSSTTGGTGVRLLRSTDGGATWSLQQTMTVSIATTPTPGAGPAVRGAFVDSRGHVYMGGVVTNCTYESRTAARGWFAEVWKSSDDGVTWTKCFTAETSAVWKFTEDSSGRVYCNEYTITPTIGGETEYPAVNIWRSDTSGANWAIWATLPKETTPNAKDGVRHIHGVYADAAGHIFAACGDANWGGLAGKTLRLDSSGSVDLDYGRPPNTNGNGLVALIANQSGLIVGGGDSSPSGIYVMNPTAALSCQVCSFRGEGGARMDGYVFDLFYSADGTLWGNVTPVTGNSSIRTSVVFSTDDGVNWGGLDLGSGIQPNTITHNKNAPSGCMFLSGAVKKVPLPKRAELTQKSRGYMPEP